MKKLLLLFLYSTLAAFSHAQNKVDLSTMTHFPGFIDFYWDDSTGKIYLDVKNLDQEFLYNSGLSAGVGSNDIGLDRGQLGQEYVVTFTKVGEKILLKA